MKVWCKRDFFVLCKSSNKTKLRRLGIPNGIIGNSNSDSNNFVILIWSDLKSVDKFILLIMIKVRFWLKLSYFQSNLTVFELNPIKKTKNVKIHWKWSKINHKWLNLIKKVNYIIHFWLISILFEHFWVKWKYFWSFLRYFAWFVCDDVKSDNKFG